MIRQNSPAAKTILSSKHERSVIKTAILGFFSVVSSVAAVIAIFSTLGRPGVSQAWTAEVGSIGLSETIVADPQTGLALFGYDPVAYFTDHEAEPGLPEFESIARGYGWRFVNPGNQRAFERNPDLYIPRFGGYDASLLAQNKLSAGDPKFFAVTENGLLLFRSERTRARFLSDGGELRLATRNWRQLRRDLSGTDQ